MAQPLVADGFHKTQGGYRPEVVDGYAEFLIEFAQRTPFGIFTSMQFSTRTVDEPFAKTTFFMDQ